MTVRPTRGGRGHRLRDRLAGEHHHLRFHGIVGKGLLPGSRRTAGSGSRRAAGRRALAARDRWIGWPRELQFRHPHPIRDSSRPVILTPGRVPDLASRVPGPGPRRLSADIGAAHGYPALLAETFADVPGFTGAG